MVFESLGEFFVYPYSIFTQAQGLNITPGQATTIDYTNLIAPLMAI